MAETATEQDSLENNIVIEEHRANTVEEEDVDETATSVPEDDTSSLGPKINDETTVSSRFEHFLETKKVRKGGKSTKVRQSKNKARKLIIRKPKKNVSELLKRRRVVKGDTEKVWQKRAKSRLVKYDPRKTLRVRNIVRNGDGNQNSARAQPSKAQLLHFKFAEAQIAKAIQLQECLNSPESCQIRR